MDDSSGSSSDSDSDTQSPLLLLLLALIAQPQQPFTPSNRTWTGQEYVDNVLNCGNPTRIYNILRMNLEIFNLLRNWLVSNTKLKGSQRVSVKEKLFLFIAIASKGLLNRQA